MSFGGAVSAMLSSLKNNKRERKSAFDKLKNVGKSKDTLHFEKKASAKELEDIKMTLQKESKITYIKNALLFGLLLFVFIYFLAFHKYH